MLRDYSQESVQAIRSVDKSIPPNAVLPATPDEIYHVDTHPDPETQMEIVLWDDILQAFKYAEQVRHKTRVVPFLKGRDFTILQPRRIAAMPDTILDVVVDTTTIDYRIAAPQIQQQGPILLPPPTYESTMRVDVASSWNVPTTCSSSSTFSAPPVATFTAQNTAVNNLDEIPLAYLSVFGRPLASPSVRRQQAVLDDQTPTATYFPVPPHPNNDNKTQLQGPQMATTEWPMARYLSQTIISASQGDKDAQVALGNMYKDGRGVVQDYQTAIDWYLKSAEQGYAAAQYSIGDLYYFGRGVRQDYVRAREWYLKAAKQGHTVSQYNVGVLFKHGRGVPLDYKRAMDWFLKAARQGHARSQFNIGILYNNGEGVPQDYARAMYWFLEAAQQGHAGSQFSIGVLYDNGQGVPQDYAQAMDWYLKAASQGYSLAHNNIGLLYNHSRGVPQDFAQAMDWYVKSAMLENNVAQFNIGALYNNGQGVPQDYAQAMNWFLKAASQGHTDSQYNAGVFYKHGRGVPQDYIKAVEWFSKAADRGHDGAKRQLAVLKKKGVTVN